MKDHQTNSLVYLRDVLKKAYYRERIISKAAKKMEMEEKRKIKGIKGSMNKAKSLVIGNVLQGDIAQIAGSLQQVSNITSVVSDPGTAIARKLLDRVKSIVLVPFKQI